MIRPHTIVIRNEENQARDHAATALYNKYYRNDLYNMATNGKTRWYACELVDAAMERCGSPYFKGPRTRFGPAARQFLDCFPHYEVDGYCLADGVTVYTDIVAKTYTVKSTVSPVFLLVMLSTTLRLLDERMTILGFTKQ